jgi:hypothetical protein
VLTRRVRGGVGAVVEVGEALLQVLDEGGAVRVRPLVLEKQLDLDPLQPAEPGAQRTQGRGIEVRDREFGVR